MLGSCSGEGEVWIVRLTGGFVSSCGLCAGPGAESESKARTGHSFFLHSCVFRSSGT